MNAATTVTMTVPDTAPTIRSASPAEHLQGKSRRGSTGRASGLERLTLRLTGARFTTRSGEGLLYLAGIFAYTISAALALTVAGGTWMFYQRWQHPSGLIAEVVTEDATFDGMLAFYVALAFFACALLIPALINLTAGAAVLGARGRERRLAALRLIGLSGADVTRMSLFEALIQTVIGTILGAVVYLVTLPLWGNLTMQGMPIEPGEMLLPVGLFALVALAVVLIGMLAAWRGLRQVRISPLGVSRRANKPALSVLRAVAFLVVLVASVVLVNALPLGTDIGFWVAFGAIVIALVAAMNLAAPWFLQLIARGMAHLPGPTMRWSARRIAADPAATWRRVSGIALLAFIGGFMALMPFSFAEPVLGGEATATFLHLARWDFTKGVIITLSVGFVLTAAAMLISQASATIERSEQTRAMARMGAPAGYALRVMWFETFAPLAVAVILGAGLGALMALPIYTFSVQQGVVADTPPILTMVVVLGAGLGLTALSLALCHPLYHRQLATQRRRND